MITIKIDPETNWFCISSPNPIPGYDVHDKNEKCGTPINILGIEYVITSCGAKEGSVDRKQWTYWINGMLKEEFEARNTRIKDALVCGDAEDIYEAYREFKVPPVCHWT